MSYIKIHIYIVSPHWPVRSTWIMETSWGASFETSGEKGGEYILVFVSSPSRRGVVPHRCSSCVEMYFAIPFIPSHRSDLIKGTSQRSASTSLTPTPRRRPSAQSRSRDNRLNLTLNRTWGFSGGLEAACVYVRVCVLVTLWQMRTSSPVRVDSAADLFVQPLRQRGSRFNKKISTCSSR